MAFYQAVHEVFRRGKTQFCASGEAGQHSISKRRFETPDDS